MPGVEIARGGMRIEAELIGDPMHETPREQTVERRPGREPAL